MVTLHNDWIPNYDAEPFPGRQNQSVEHLALALGNITHTGHWPRLLLSQPAARSAGQWLLLFEVVYFACIQPHGIYILNFCGKRSAPEDPKSKWQVTKPKLSHWLFT